MHRWGKLMNDELAAIAGKHEELVGRMQEKYGLAKEVADQQIKDFKKTVGQLKKSNGQLIQLQKSARKVTKVGKSRLRGKKRVQQTSRSAGKK